MVRISSITLLLVSLIAFPAAASVKVQVDLSERALRIIDGGSIVKQYDVAVGKADKPTPTGAFEIEKIVWNPSWHPPDEKWARGKEAKGPGEPGNPMKRVKIFFSEPDYYIHGTDDVDSLGDAASHGCVRMSTGDVTELAKLLMAEGGKPMPEPWYKRILHFHTTKVIFLSDPIDMVVTR